MEGAPYHLAVRRWMAAQIEAGVQLGLAHQVVYEFVHVVTDGRRFERPMTVGAAASLMRKLWSAREVQRIAPRVAVVPRLCELMEQLRLGRKRVLDTALAATLEAASVRRLATLNPGDFGVLAFLEVIDPSSEA